jgi:hypothetical protein
MAVNRQKTKVMKTRKTTAYILTVLFSAILVSAGAAPARPGKKADPAPSETIDNIARFAITAPREADFSDLDPEAAPAPDYLKPVAPKTASFEDAEEVYNMPVTADVLKKTAPTTPKEADFNDSYDFNHEFLSRIAAPVTPLVATFDEIF